MEQCPYCQRKLAGEICVAHGYVGKVVAPTTASDLGAAPALHGVPSGGIIMWSGAASDVPAGWLICDGTNGTPNLVGRFIIGTKTDSGATYDVGDTGGAATVTLTSAQSGLKAHTHGPGQGTGFLNYDTSSAAATMVAGSGYSVATATAANTAENASSAHENLPPYYSLCYIFKT